MVTEKMIEAAAEAYWMQVYGRHRKANKWPDDVYGSSQELFRDGCRAALEAALSTDAEPVGELQSVDPKEFDEAIQLLPSVMRPSLSKVIIAAIEEQRRVIAYFKRTSRARQLAFEAATAPAPPAPSVAVKAGPLAHALASELERMGQPRPNGDILHDALSLVLPALSAQVQDVAIPKGTDDEQ